MKKLLTLSFCIAILFGCKKQESKELSAQEIQIKDALLKQKKTFDVPGIAFGLIKNDTIIYADAHGVRSLNSKSTLTTKSVFHMASVSKTFVATAIMQLVEQGKIDLDGKLIEYLPYFKMSDSLYKNITIQQILTHTSGIPNTDNYEWDKPQYDDGAIERYARSHKDLKLDFKPGERVKYSNPAFDILCDVIAKVSGMTFENYMQQHIFEPIGMKNSTFFKPDVSKELATLGHIIGNSLQTVVSKIYPYNRRHAGSSTLHSNVEDMLLWAQVYINKGKINGKEIFSEKSYELLTTVQTQKDQDKVCLSWFPGRINGSPIFYHEGQDTGFNSFFGFIPEKKSAVVLMVNSDRFWRMNVAAAILKNTLFQDSIPIKGPIHFKLKNHILTDGIEKVREIYTSEEKKEPHEYYIRPKYLDNLGYWLIDRNHPKEALDVFLFMTELEPKDAGWVDSVGDAYKAMDSINLAIKWYQKALQMDPEQDFSREKIDELLKRK